jgi:hypothetical protein
MVLLQEFLQEFTKDGDSEAKKHVTSVTSMKFLPIYPASMIVARMKTL